MRTFIFYALLIFAVVLVTLILSRIKKLYFLIGEITDDTLKNKEGKWSMPRIMMINSFNVFVIAYFYDLYKVGHLNEIASIALLTVAVTGKIADAQAKKIDPTITGPSDDIKN